MLETMASGPIGKSIFLINVHRRPFAVFHLPCITTRLYSSLGCLLDEGPWQKHLVWSTIERQCRTVIRVYWRLFGAKKRSHARDEMLNKRRSRTEKGACATCFVLKSPATSPIYHEKA